MTDENAKKIILDILASGGTPTFLQYTRFLDTKPDEIWYYVPVKWLVQWFSGQVSRATIYRLKDHGAIRTMPMPHAKVYHIKDMVKVLGIKGK